MEEILIKEYLDSKSKGMSDHEFMKKMKEFFSTKYDRGMGFRDPRWDAIEDYRRLYGGGIVRRHSDDKLMTMLEELDHDDKERLIEMIHHDSYSKGSMYDESHAKHIVSEMYHISGDKKYIGEKYDMNKAKEVHEKYKASIPEEVDTADVYIAINAQYHDYCNLFKGWFGSNIDAKIIESAIVFWFKDVDYAGGNKVHKYFEEA